MKLSYTRICLLIAALSGTSMTYAQQQPIMTTSEKNQKTITRLFEEALNKRNLQLLHELVAEDYVAADGQRGPAGFQQPVTVLLQAFPDLQWKIEDIVATADKVAVKTSWVARQEQPYNGVAPNGKLINSNAMAFYHLKEGRIVKGQVLVDRLGFLQQQGLIPADLSTLIRSK